MDARYWNEPEVVENQCHRKCNGTASAAGAPGYCGGVSNTEGLPEAVEAEMAGWLFSDVCQTRVVRNQHGDSSGVRGAAWLWDAAE